MLDLKYLCDNIDFVREALSYRSGSYDVDAVFNLNQRRKSIIAEVEELKARRNSVSAEIARLKKEKKDADALISEMREAGDRIKALDAELAEVEEKLNTALLSIPNVPHSSVPKGKSDEDNVQVRYVGEPAKFPFEAKPHWEIGEKLKILDPALAAKISGARFTVYRGLGAALERAVINLMLDTHTSYGYTEVFTPFMVNRESMIGTGQLPKFEEDMFAVKGTNYYLIPTAEVPVTNLMRGEILDESELPVCYCAYSACFRAEANPGPRGLISRHVSSTSGAFQILATRRV